MRKWLLTASALAILGAAPASAQVNPVKMLGLEPGDLAPMEEAAAKLYADPGRAPGSVERWQADSGSSGAVRLAETYEFEGMPCARLQHQIKRAKYADPVQMTVDRCRTADGEWKIR